MRREGPGPLRSRVQVRLLIRCRYRWRGELPTGANPELAVDVARVGTDSLDTHPQCESDLCVGATLLEQGKHFGLTLGQQAHTRGARNG
jgi:hypothetical protein